jgi:hypothetical protein
MESISSLHTHTGYKMLAGFPMLPLGAVWKKKGLYSGVVSKFVATLSQVCASIVWFDFVTLPSRQGQQWPSLARIAHKS